MSLLHPTCVHSVGDVMWCVVHQIYQEAGSENWIGMVCQQTSPAAIAEAAIEDAKFVCTRQYGDAPDVTLHGRLDLTFSCETEVLMVMMWYGGVFLRFWRWHQRGERLSGKLCCSSSVRVFCPFPERAKVLSL